MTKRLLGFATAVALALCSVIPAFAENATPLPRWQWQNLMFRNAAAVNVVASGFLADSVSASGNTARADTTAPVILPALGMYIPMYPPTATAESLTVAAFRLEPDPNGTVTVAADSIYLNMQLSMDGTNWVTATPTGIAFQAANTVNATQIGAFVLEAGSQDVFTRFYKQQYEAGGSLSLPTQAGTPTDVKWFGWRYARWIVGFGDATNSAGVFRAQFGYWSLQPGY